MAHSKLADYVIIIILGDVTDKRFRLQANPTNWRPKLQYDHSTVA